MPSFTTERAVPFTAAQMYALVAGVERYPEFLPMCTGLTVLSRAPAADGEDLTARMSVGYKSISEKFTTRVFLRPTENRIEAQYLDGPFKRLQNIWRFSDTAEGSSAVHFYINYEFKSLMLGVLVGSMFDSAFRRFSEAFEQRAHAVYGTPKPVTG